MNKPIFKTVRCVLPAGQIVASASIHIDKAENIYAGAVVRNDQDAIIRLGLEENGQRIQEALAAQWWDGQLGSFEQRAILTSYTGGTNLSVVVSTANPLDEAVEVEFAFQIWQKPAYGTNADGNLIPGSC